MFPFLWFDTRAWRAPPTHRPSSLSLPFITPAVQGSWTSQCLTFRKKQSRSHVSHRQNHTRSVASKIFWIIWDNQHPDLGLFRLLQDKTCWIQKWGFGIKLTLQTVEKKFYSWLKRIHQEDDFIVFLSFMFVIPCVVLLIVDCGKFSNYLDHNSVLGPICLGHSLDPTVLP